MSKNNEVDRISDNLKRLIYEIPLEQRKRIKRSKSYREGWLDCTRFWKVQLNKTFKNER
jgi:hypothetical protein